MTKALLSLLVALTLVGYAGAAYAAVQAADRPTGTYITDDESYSGCWPYGHRCGAVVTCPTR
ncbi:MAG: hypothetical protein P4M13_06055 [Alphaproteobacteria bacterium]|nr:hypothetical protein [Alphaproteobacteria bacterium]